MASSALGQRPRISSSVRKWWLARTDASQIPSSPCRTAFPGTPYQKQDAGQDERVDVPCDCEQVEHVGLFYVCVCVNVLTNIRRIFNVVGIGVTLYFVILSRGGTVSLSVILFFVYHAV